VRQCTAERVVCAVDQRRDHFRHALPSRTSRRLRRDDFGRDAVEHGVELDAESGGAQDDGDADQGGDEAVFDGRRTGLVLGKAVQKGLHCGTPTRKRPAQCNTSSVLRGR
jgi:hypothetical protein